MATSVVHRSIGIWSFALLAIVFGLMTIKSGGSVLFIDGEARQAAGHYVPFVLWFNFCAGWVYIFAGIGLWLLRPWAASLSLILALATIAVFVVFGLHILNGGEYEMRTVVALTLRSVVWSVISVFAWYQLVRNK